MARIVLYQTIRIRGKRMSPVDLTVEDLIVRILQGHEKYVHIKAILHENLPATQVTFYPDSKTQKGCFIFRDGKAWKVKGVKPGFVIGIITKRGGHVHIEEVAAPTFNAEVALAAG